MGCSAGPGPCRSSGPQQTLQAVEQLQCTACICIIVPLCRVCSPVSTASLRISHFLDQRACLKLSASATRSHSHPVFTAPLNEGQGIHSTSLGTVKDSKPPPLRHVAACLGVPGLVSPRRVVCLARLRRSASSCRQAGRARKKGGQQQQAGNQKVEQRQQHSYSSHHAASTEVRPAAPSLCLFSSLTGSHPSIHAIHLHSSPILLYCNRNKVDVSKLTPAEQQAFRLYGKLPSRPVAKSQERKYFGRFACSLLLSPAVGAALLSSLP